MKKLFLTLLIVLATAFGTTVSAQDAFYKGLSEVENINIVSIPGLAPGQRCFFGPNIVMSIGYMPGVEDVLMAYVNGSGDAIVAATDSYIQGCELIDLGISEKGSYKWSFAGMPIPESPGYYRMLIVKLQTPQLSLVMRYTGMVSLNYFKAKYNVN